MIRSPDPALGAAPVDLLVVGGGINGTGIARDAAGRGLKVLLVEKDDLANHTSSASTKLIHGGLRYLEYGEFRLVRESLIERQHLLSLAPHIIWPLRFVLPQSRSPRPAWMVRLGLLLYDHLGGRKRLPGTASVELSQSSLGAGLSPRAGKAFVYSDCWVEDSRLVILNALDAAERGATIATRTRLIAATRTDARWTADLEQADGMRRQVSARALVNAAGPWVADVVGKTIGAHADRLVRLVKGSHLVLPRLYPGEHAFVMQNPDRRIVFAIPYEGRFTLIGTTDEAWNDAPGPSTISEGETRYLLDTIARYFDHKPEADEVVWSYSGIRPLYDDHAASASAVTRDYVLDLDVAGGLAPLLSVYGGKITTYRKLAEHALRDLAFILPGMGAPWTAGVPLPGGDMEDADFDRFLEDVGTRYPAMSPTLLRRLARAYGTRMDAILGGRADTCTLGVDLGGGLHTAEVDYLVRQEWAQTAEDVLWRRSKLGLHVPAGTAERLADYLA